MTLAGVVARRVADLDAAVYCRRDATSGDLPVPVSSERRGRILIAQLERAEKRNAMNGEMTRGLDAAMNQLEDDPALWVGILAGSNGVFSAGTDMRDSLHNSTERGGPYGVVRRK